MLKESGMVGFARALSCILIEQSADIWENLGESCRFYLPEVQGSIRNDRVVWVTAAAVSIMTSWHKAFPSTRGGNWRSRHFQSSKNTSSQQSCHFTILEKYALVASPNTMARLALLFAVLSWLAASQAQEQQVQQVLNDDPMTPHPLPQAAEVVRKKFVLGIGRWETS